MRIKPQRPINPRICRPTASRSTPRTGSRKKLSDRKSTRIRTTPKMTAASPPPPRRTPGAASFLAGGDGEGRSGIANVILICRVDLDTKYLSEQPVGRIVLGTDLCYRMAVHPRGGGLVCALPNRCKRFDWENIMSPREGDETGEEGDEVIKELKDVGRELALAFNQEGSVLATGGEVGKARTFSLFCVTEEEKALVSCQH